MTPQERKAKVLKLREEHENYIYLFFQVNYKKVRISLLNLLVLNMLQKILKEHCIY